MASPGAHADPGIHSLTGVVPIQEWGWGQAWAGGPAPYLLAMAPGVQASLSLSLPLCEMDQVSLFCGGAFRFYL